MKKSIFKGRLLKDNELKGLYESNKSFNPSIPFDEKVDELEKYGIHDWEQLYSLHKNDFAYNLFIDNDTFNCGGIMFYKKNE
jgi:hypothetical protein